jgi:hypothetical protein
MNFKTTGLLVALLLIIGAVWVFYPKAPAPVEEAAPPKPATEDYKNVFDPAPKDDQIVHLEIERAGKPKLAFERTDPASEKRGQENWRMLAPLATTADGNKLMSIVRTFGTLQSRARFEAGAGGQPTAADAGLEPPAATLTIRDQDGKDYTLEVGRKAALSNDTYVRVAGQKTIHVATRELATLYDKKVNEFRAPRLIAGNVDDVTHVRITHEGRTYDLTKGADGEWAVNEPVRAYADKNKVREKLITPLVTLNAVEFADEPADPAALGFDAPYLTVTVTCETKPKPKADESADPNATTQPAPLVETKEFRVGGFADLKQERRFALVAGEPTAALLNKANVENLVPKLNELRDPRLLRMKSADITQLELTAAGATATLKKESGVWQGAGAVTEVDPESVTQLVDALTGLNAIDFVDQPETPAKYGLDQPQATVVVTAAGTPAPVKITFGGATPSGRNFYLQREGEPTVLVATEPAVNKVAVRPQTLRSRDIFKFDAGQISKLDIQRGPMHYVVEREAGAWKLHEPAGAPLDEGVLGGVTANLARLRASSFVANGEPAGPGFDHPAMTLRFELSAPATDSQPAAAATSHVLHFARPDDKHTYARKEGEPAIFELDDSVWRALSAELLSARLFAFEPDQIASIKVTAPGGTVEFGRDKDKWAFTPDPTVAVEQKKVQDFAQDLARLRVEAYQAWQAGNFKAAGLDPAPASVLIKLKDGRDFMLHLAQEQPGELPRVAGLLSEQRLCLLKRADAQKLLRGLDEYVVSDKPVTPPPAPPGALDEE